MKTKTVRPPSTKSIQRLVSALQKKGAREVAGRTYDHRGSLVGTGKQGLRLLGLK